MTTHNLTQEIAAMASPSSSFAEAQPQQQPQGLVEKTAALTVSETNGEGSAGNATTDAQSSTPQDAQDPTSVPPHRSHDPQFNQKRSDPFQFGSRYLNEAKDNVFEFNAWDHVETDDTYKEYSEQQYAMQRESPVSDFDKNRFNSDPAKWWNLFYKNNTANFFKNRKWLQQEFPILSQITLPDAGPITLLEIGAGAGNTAFPVLAQNSNPGLKIHACDFSKKAVDVMRSHEQYDSSNAERIGSIQADVWDLAGDVFPPDLEEGSIDIAVMIFVFSALSPQQWEKAVDNVYRLLKPGGQVLFRDYGRGDLAQVRFKKGRYLEENFYIRGDGTRVYFFDEDELAGIWKGEVYVDAPAGEQDGVADDVVAEGASGKAKDVGDATSVVGGAPRFEQEELGVDRRLLVNRAKKLKMYRCWIQARFRKK